MHANGTPSSKAPGEVSLLIAIDARDIAKVLTSAAHESGVECLLARDGLQALMLARTHRPDAILLGLTLPLLSGRDVLAHLRKFADVYRTVVIVIGNREDALDHRVARELGADDYHATPVLPELLLRKVARLVGQRRQQPSAANGGRS